MNRYIATQTHQQEPTATPSAVVCCNANALLTVTQYAVLSALNAAGRTKPCSALPFRRKSVGVRVKSLPLSTKSCVRGSVDTATEIIF